MDCELCGSPLFTDGSTMTTCVGYTSPAGHDHDDNCRSRYYRCANGHGVSLSKRNKCPTCDWRGRAECFCHKGGKLDEWPTT